MFSASKPAGEIEHKDSAEELIKKAKEIYKTRAIFDAENKNDKIIGETLNLLEGAANKGSMEAMRLFVTVTYNNCDCSDNAINSREKALSYLQSSANKECVSSRHKICQYYNEGRPKYGIKQDKAKAEALAKTYGLNLETIAQKRSKHAQPGS